ncbi:MAG: hypothetical protein HYZ37_10320 [Candidatus Solibacter usitatus]|nr:hypothetical protein [Candidatus Solibacter usitatus]
MTIQASKSVEVRMHYAMGFLPILFFGLLSPANAAPKLRLTSTTVGPLSIAQGANGTAQTIEAYNDGDGALSLQATTTASWLSANAGGERACTSRGGTCNPITVNLQTAPLARGLYTASVMVSDPNALDAPQFITITVQMGGGVPDTVNFYVPPNGSADSYRFSTNSQLIPNVTTQGGGPWLSLNVDGSGTFRFLVPYRITARHLSGMQEGVYTGLISTSGAGLAAENKTISVRMQVTSQPIARASTTAVAFRLASNGPSSEQFVAVFNGGASGTLSVSAATAATTSGGSWLSVTSGTNSVSVKANPSGVPNGTYAGTVTINTNGVNNTLTIPVQLEVVAQTAPITAFGGVLNSGNYDGGLAPGSVAAIFGEQLSFQDPGSGGSIPLATNLADVRVLVNEQAAPLYYTSYNQINFQVPYETAPGDAVVRVERGGQRGNGVAVKISPRAPRIIQVGDGGIIVNARDASLAMRGGRAARAGDVVTIYCIGFGGTNGANVSGAAAPSSEPLARISPMPKVVFGNAFAGAHVVDAIYAGLTPTLVGLYQVNAVIPPGLTGEVPMAIAGDGYQTNSVLVPIQ